MEQEDVVVAKFRNLINQFKRPYVEMTEEPSQKVEQSVGPAFHRIFENFDKLYSLLKVVLLNGGVIPEAVREDAGQMPVIQVFEGNGILRALQENPRLKESLLRYLDLDLKVYPYTLNPGHINALTSAHTEPSSEVVGNEEDGTPQ